MLIAFILFIIVIIVLVLLIWWLLKSTKRMEVEPIFVGNSSQSGIRGNLVQPVNQFSCNACWAIATSQVVSDRLHLQGKLPQDDEINYYAYHDIVVNLTPEHDGCEVGAFLETGMDMFTTHGAPLMSETRDRQFDDKAISSDKSARMIRTSGWKNLSGASVAQIKQEIASNGPVVATMNIYGSFDNFRGPGIYSPLPSESADSSMLHMVSIVGYDDSDSTWIVRNSYGTSWGNNGLVKIKQGDRRMDIEQYVYAPIL